jgi:hypothetical protein
MNLTIPENNFLSKRYKLLKFILRKLDGVKRRKEKEKEQEKKTKNLNNCF